MPLKTTLASAIPIFVCLLSPLLPASPLRVLAWDDSVAARKLALAGAKGSVELVAMNPFYRSDVINVGGTPENPPRLEALDRTDADGAHLSATLRVPVGVKLPLVLLLPDEKAPTGIRPLVLEDDPAGFRWGSLRVINTTGKALVLRWEKKLVRIPATWEPTEVAPGGESRNMEVAVYQESKPGKPLYSSIWRFHRTSRQIVFVVPGSDPVRGLLDFKFITETQGVAGN